MILVWGGTSSNDTKRRFGMNVRTLPLAERSRRSKIIGIHKEERGLRRKEQQRLCFEVAVVGISVGKAPKLHHVSQIVRPLYTVL